MAILKIMKIIFGVSFEIFYKHPIIRLKCFFREFPTKMTILALISPLWSFLEFFFGKTYISVTLDGAVFVTHINLIRVNVDVVDGKVEIIIVNASDIKTKRHRHENSTDSCSSDIWIHSICENLNIRVKWGQIEVNLGPFGVKSWFKLGWKGCCPDRSKNLDRFIGIVDWANWSGFNFLAFGTSLDFSIFEKFGPRNQRPKSRQ